MQKDVVDRQFRRYSVECDQLGCTEQLKIDLAAWTCYRIIMTDFGDRRFAHSVGTLEGIMMNFLEYLHWCIKDAHP